MAYLVRSFVHVADLFQEIQPLRASLDYHLERQNILTANVANVDTPGYIPRDLQRVDQTSFAAELRMALQKTQPGHLPGGGASATTGRVVDDTTAGCGNDGNFVSLDREAAKVASNQLRYDIVSTLIAGELADLALAANDGKG